MALIHCDFYSQILDLSSSMVVILPDPILKTPAGQSKNKPVRFPTLYLLHGLSDDHTIWQRRTSIERYASVYNLAIVMPAVHRSFYTNMVHGLNYWDYISQEVPTVARYYFPLSSSREENYVAGLSMGGYGAFKLALSCPEKFSAAGSFSGAIDIAGLVTFTQHQRDDELSNIFGNLDDVAGSENDLFSLAKTLAESGNPCPKLYQACGTRDMLLRFNRDFKSYAESLGLQITYHEGRAGHEWSFWDKQIQEFLKWLPLTRR